MTSWYIMTFDLALLPSSHKPSVTLPSTLIIHYHHTLDADRTDYREILLRNRNRCRYTCAAELYRPSRMDGLETGRVRRNFVAAGTLISSICLFLCWLCIVGSPPGFPFLVLVLPSVL